MIQRTIISFILILLSCIVKSQNAPVTHIGEFYNQIPGEITVPLTVTGFTDIGVISLSLDYDPAVLTFLEGTLNPSLSGMGAVNNTILPSGMHRIIIGWFGNGLTLPDGSTLIGLHFNFFGGTTELTWFDDGSSCEYGDAAYNALNDFPYACYYSNGIITTAKWLNLTLLLEGLYNPATQRMNSPLGFSSGPCTDGIADNLLVELRSGSDYSEIIFATDNRQLSMQGQSGILVPADLNGNYYITVRHRNSIATVSASPVSFAESEISYDFTTHASKAYGNNMKQMADGRWALFGGDVNQDGVVDTADMSPVDNDAGAFASGYLATDINGDNITDTADMSIIDNNASVFAGSITP